MSRKVNKKVAVLITTILILSLSLGAVVFADDHFQTLSAWFGNLNIYRNNQQVQLSAKPFIVDGTTYVPLRAVSELFDKEVGWDGVNYRIDLNDKPDENLAYMTQELVEAQIKVLELETKVAQLEAELESKKTPTSYNLRELESYLNKEYDTYKKVDFKIDLYESRNNIDVAIYVDLDYDYSRWHSLTDRDIEDFLQYIVDDILDSFPDASVAGYIEDSSSRWDNELLSFTTTSRGKVSVDNKYSDIRNIDDMEDYLNEYHSRYSNNIRFDIYLLKDGNYIEVDLYARSYSDGNNWFYLSDANKRRYLKEICDVISDNFPRATIEGYVMDYDLEDILDIFDYDSKGNINL